MPSLTHQSPHRARPRAGSKNHARRLDPVSQASCVVSSRRNCSKRQYQKQILSENLNRHYDSNQQYSITAVSDGGGTVVERYAYSAYGQVTIADASGTEISNSAIANRYTYTGREWDEGLSLFHYRARMYDAVAGRFCSKDPIGYNSIRINLYEMVSSMPTNATDPMGHSIERPPATPAGPGDFREIITWLRWAECEFSCIVSRDRLLEDADDFFDFLLIFCDGDLRDCLDKKEKSCEECDDEYQECLREAIQTYYDQIDAAYDSLEPCKRACVAHLPGRVPPNPPPRQPMLPQ